MTHDDERDRDLDAWLRQPMERLAPPSGSWERVSQRARRRKLAKALAGTVAGVVIVAGAVPAVIAVRHNSNNQQLALGHRTQLPSPKTTTLAPTSKLSGFFPLSVSFVSLNTGYAWGTVPNSSRGVVAETTDQGADWTLVGRPHVAAALNSATGDGQIRMVSGTVGYIFGPKLFVTRDSGKTWKRLASPGYIDDLEAVNQQAWALVRPGGQTSTSVQLYRSSADSPDLKKVDGVNGDAQSGTDSIAVNLYGTNKRKQKLYSTDVLIGSSTIWQAKNGGNWNQLPDPCPAGPSSTGASLRAALIASSGTSAKTMAVACGLGETGDLQAKGVFTTSNNGRRWTRTDGVPSDIGYLETLTLGPDGTIIIGDSGGGAQILTGGAEPGGSSSWTTANAGVKLGFVGFIAPHTVIALQDPASNSPGTFAISDESGTSWRSYHF